MPGKLCCKIGCSLDCITTMKKKSPTLSFLSRVSANLPWQALPWCYVTARTQIESIRRRQKAATRSWWIMGVSMLKWWVVATTGMDSAINQMTMIAPCDSTLIRLSQTRWFRSILGNINVTLRGKKLARTFLTNKLSAKWHWHSTSKTDLRNSKFLHKRPLSLCSLPVTMKIRSSQERSLNL